MRRKCPYLKIYNFLIRKDLMKFSHFLKILLYPFIYMEIYRKREAHIDIYESIVNGHIRPYIVLLLINSATV